MAKQNFAETARYFERRASKATTVGLRQQFQSAAAHYHSMAEIHRHYSDSASANPLVAAIPPRRQRLIELLHAGNVSTQLSVVRKGHESERQKQSMVEEGRSGTPSEMLSSN
jgi:hypothetical protein